MTTMLAIHSPDQLANSVRWARKRLGLTQPQLALAAGVGTRFVVDLESGKPTVRLENVLRVIDALGGQLQLTGLPGADAADAAYASAAETITAQSGPASEANQESRHGA